LRVNKLLLVTLIFTVLVASLSIVANMPSSTPYSPFNNGDKGYSEVLSILNNAILTRDLGNIEPGSTVIVPVLREINESEYKSLVEILDKGSTLVFLDENGFVNGFLEYIGLKARIMHVKVLDEVSKVKSREYPLLTLRINGENYEVVAHEPSYIAINDFDNLIAYGNTSNYAYADVDGNKYYSIGEEMKSYTIIALFRIKEGSLWLISDLDLFTNNVVELGDNTKLLKQISESNKTFFVLNYVDLNSLDEAKFWYISALSTHILGNTLVNGLLVYVLLLTVTVIIKYAEEGI